MLNKQTLREIARLELPHINKFTKIHLVKLVYEKEDKIEIKTFQFDSETDLSAIDLDIDFKKLVKASVYKRMTPSDIYPHSVYERIPHFEKRLHELQKPYLTKKHSPTPRAKPARTAESELTESNLEQQTRSEQTTPVSSTPKPVISKPNNEKHYLPKFDGYFLIFSNRSYFYLTLPPGILKYPDARKLEPEKSSLINKLTLNSGWIGTKPKLRDWPNLLQEAEKQGANIVARGKGRPYSGFYYLFSLSDENVLRDAAEYTVSNFKEKNITPVLK